MVSVLAFKFDDQSLNLAGKLNFLYETTKISKKRLGLAHLLLTDLKEQIFRPADVSWMTEIYLEADDFDTGRWQLSQNRYLSQSKPFDVLYSQLSSSATRFSSRFEIQ